MNNKSATCLRLPSRTKRMARMAAAPNGISVSEWVALIIEDDCCKTGIADLVDFDFEEMHRGQ